MSKQDNQIVALNTMVKIRIAPSKIHGVGIFALRDIPKGTRMYLSAFPQQFTLPFGSFGKLFPEVKQIIMERWPNVVLGSHFMYPDTNFQAYCNHSDKPNYDAANDVSLVDIKKGKEITEDYRSIGGWQQVFPWLNK